MANYAISPRSNQPLTAAQLGPVSPFTGYSPGSITGGGPIDNRYIMPGVGIGAGAGINVGQGNQSVGVPVAPTQSLNIGGVNVAGIGAALAPVLPGLVAAGAGYLMGKMGGNGGGGGPSLTGGGGGDYVFDGTLMQGPGLKEPHPTMIAKEWKIRMDSKQGDFNLQFYRLVNGSVMCYNQRTGIWKKWRPTKPIVIGKRLPSHKTITRLRRFLKKHTDDAKTILKITQPTALRQPKRSR